MIIAITKNFHEELKGLYQYHQLEQFVELVAQFSHDTKPKIEILYDNNSTIQQYHYLIKNGNDFKNFLKRYNSWIPLMKKFETQHILSAIGTLFYAAPAWTLFSIAFNISIFRTMVGLLAIGLARYHMSKTEIDPKPLYPRELDTMTEMLEDFQRTKYNKPYDPSMSGLQQFGLLTSQPAPQEQPILQRPDTIIQIPKENIEEITEVTPLKYTH